MAVFGEKTQLAAPMAVSGKKAQLAAPMILGLLQEKAIAADPRHPEPYDLSGWKDSIDLSSSGTALWADGSALFYDAEALAKGFLEDSTGLEKRFIRLCLDAFSKKCETQNAKAGVFFPGGGPGAGQGGVSGTDHGANAGPESEAALLSRRDGVDYRSLLHRFCVPREEAIPDLDSFDYVPYLYGQGMSVFPDTQQQISTQSQLHSPTLCENALQDFRLCLIEPLEYSEVNRLDELAIAIDTSGSCSGELVRRFLEETWSILRQRENFFTRMRIHLIQCDSMIQEYRIFTSVEEWEAALDHLKIQGNGSTDFCPVFDLLNAQIAKKEIRSLRALLYFTDGDGIYPREAPPYETAFVFVNQQSIKGKVPDWAQSIVLDSL